MYKHRASEQCGPFMSLLSSYHRKRQRRTTPSKQNSPIWNQSSLVGSTICDHVSSFLYIIASADMFSATGEVYAVLAFLASRGLGSFRGKGIVFHHNWSDLCFQLLGKFRGNLWKFNLQYVALIAACCTQ